MRASSSSRAAFAGDEVVPGANMVLERRREIAAAPEEIWPWLVQLGKGRAGWYLTRRVEKALIPRSRRAARSIEPRWQKVQPGDHVPDFGGTLEAVIVDAPHALVYRTERRNTQFSWALLLEPVSGQRTIVHLRFRGRLRSGGLVRKLIVNGSEAFDRVTAEALLNGLRERVESESRCAWPSPVSPLP